MLITQQTHGTVMVLKLVGKFEGGGADAKLDRIARTLIEDGFRQIILNFKGVRFLSSTGIGILIKLKTVFEAAGGRMIICDINERAIAVIYVMRLEEKFEIVGGVGDALAAFAAVGKADPHEQAEAEA